MYYYITQKGIKKLQKTREYHRSVWKEILEFASE
jgi:hypothetical protein